MIHLTSHINQQYGPALYKLAIFSAALLSLLAIASCKTISTKNDCLTVDWHVAGYKDGKSGLPASKFNEHKESCARHLISPNEERYLAGHKDGIKNYCSPENAFKLGFKNGKYNGACPQPTEPDFLLAFNRGKTLFAVRKGLHENKNSMKRSNRKISNLYERLIRSNEKLMQEAMDKKQSDRMYVDLDKYKKQLEKIKSDVSLTEKKLQEINQLVGDLE